MYVCIYVCMYVCIYIYIYKQTALSNQGLAVPPVPLSVAKPGKGGSKFAIRRMPGPQRQHSGGSQERGCPDLGAPRADLPTRLVRGLPFAITGSLFGCSGCPLRKVRVQQFGGPRQILIFKG